MNSQNAPRLSQEVATVNVRRKRLTQADYNRFQPMIRRLAIRTARRVPSHVTVNDLIGYAWLGLVEAHHRASADMPESEFEAYANCRVRGAMLDYLRSLDPMSRTMRAASKQVSRAVVDLTKKHGRVPEEAEVASALDVSLETYRDKLSEFSTAGMAGIDVTEIRESDLTAGVLAIDEELAKRSALELVASTVSTLPTRLQRVLALYYQESCTFREIGAVLGVTESRACQIHASAIHHLRAALDGVRE